MRRRQRWDADEDIKWHDVVTYVLFYLAATACGLRILSYYMGAQS